MLKFRHPLEDSYIFVNPDHIESFVPVLLAGKRRTVTRPTLSSGACFDVLESPQRVADMIGDYKG